MPEIAIPTKTLKSFMDFVSLYVERKLDWANQARALILSSNMLSEKRFDRLLLFRNGDLIYEACHYPFNLPFYTTTSKHRDEKQSLVEIASSTEMSWEKLTVLFQNINMGKIPDHFWDDDDYYIKLIIS